MQRLRIVSNDDLLTIKVKTNR